MAIDYRSLPDEVKRELVYDSLRATKLVFALSNLTGQSPEIWMERASMQAFQEMQAMTSEDIEDAIAQFEQARQGFGVTRVDIDQPRGFGK